jgi:hypothetical protein
LIGNRDYFDPLGKLVDGDQEVGMSTS